MSNNSVPLITIQITSDVNTVVNERRFASNITIGDLKNKLELITGASSITMTLKLYANEQFIANLDDCNAILCNYLSDNYRNIRIHVSDLNLKVGQYEDTSEIEKFELKDEDYEQRSESLRAFKMTHKLGRFADDAARKANELIEKEKEKAMTINVGNRCEVTVKGHPKRHGTVMFVGETHFKEGFWIGVKYDEPLGKNDGSFDGKRYFQCPQKYGSFVKPSDVQIGDFPEEQIDFDEI